MTTGSVVLLDVNVLLALCWPNHLHHQAARRWFGEHHAEGWATCPLTESGFIRISSNPRIFQDAVSPGEAMAALRTLRSQAGHQFWNDDTTLCEVEERFQAPVVTHNQVTDAHLLSLVRSNRGKFATFDRAIQRLLVTDESPDVVVLLP